jgi:putative transposase
MPRPLRLEDACYVVLNPMRARMVGSPGDYPRSSYRAITGEDTVPEWLDRHAILAAFGQAGAQAMRCRSFVAAGQGQPSPCEHIKMFLGLEAFVESMQRKVANELDVRDVAQAKRRSVVRSLPEYDGAHADRNEAIKTAYASGGYTMGEIGDYFGLHHSRVSKIIRGAPGRGGQVQAHVKT